MPSYSAQIPPADRWRIIAYIRVLQLSQHADASMLRTMSRSASRREGSREYRPRPPCPHSVGSPTPAPAELAELHALRRDRGHRRPRALSVARFANLAAAQETEAHERQEAVRGCAYLCGLHLLVQPAARRYGPADDRLPREVLVGPVAAPADGSRDPHAAALDSAVHPARRLREQRRLLAVFLDRARKRPVRRKDQTRRCRRRPRQARPDDQGRRGHDPTRPSSTSVNARDRGTSTSFPGPRSSCVAIVLFAIWGTLIFFLNKWGKKRQTRPTPAEVDAALFRLERLSGPGIIIYAITITAAATQWVMSLEPGWASTMFPVIFAINQFLTAFAFCLAMFLLLGQRPPLKDADAAEVPARHGHAAAGVHAVLVVYLVLAVHAGLDREPARGNPVLPEAVGTGGW